MSGVMAFTQTILDSPSFGSLVLHGRGSTLRQTAVTGHGKSLQTLIFVRNGRIRAQERDAAPGTKRVADDSDDACFGAFDEIAAVLDTAAILIMLRPRI
jgi:hypothetical protein